MLEWIYCERLENSSYDYIKAQRMHVLPRSCSIHGERCLVIVLLCRPGVMVGDAATEPGTLVAKS